MKRTILTIALLSTFFAVKGQPDITDLSYPTSVNLFQLFEISFKLGPYQNPYDPDTISVYAIFSGPNNHCDSVIGFYYEGYEFYMDTNEWYEHAVRNTGPNDSGWRIRFTPNSVGSWTFCVHAIDCHGETIACSNKAVPYGFYCLPVSNAKGFITKANSRYLKRDIVKNEHRMNSSYYPVGPDVAWYQCVDNNWSKPYGIYEYKQYVDSLSGRGNYMRVFLNRYKSLNLYGPEITQIENGNPVVYFDSLLNQKDAAELDYIINYAKQKDISLMLCVFSSGDFSYRDSEDPNDVNCWEMNPYNTVINTPCQFFENENTRRVAKNLIRYIVARWGYATNIMSWELWNEVTNVSCDSYKPLEEEIFIWHKIMGDYIREIDPFHHCISTSMSEDDSYLDLFSNLYMYLDFVQWHDYQNINKAKSKEQFSYILFNLSSFAHTSTPMVMCIH